MSSPVKRVSPFSVTTRSGTGGASRYVLTVNQIRMEKHDIMTRITAFLHQGESDLLESFASKVDISI